MLLLLPSVRKTLYDDSLRQSSEFEVPVCSGQEPESRWIGPMTQNILLLLFLLTIRNFLGLFTWYHSTAPPENSPSPSS